MKPWRLVNQFIADVPNRFAWPVGVVIVNNAWALLVWGNLDIEDIQEGMILFMDWEIT